MRVKENVTAKNSFYSNSRICFYKDIIKESMITPVKRDARLINPLNEYTNNDAEASNFMIKYTQKFNAMKPCQFIDLFRDLICLQYRNEKRATLRKVLSE